MFVLKHGDYENGWLEVRFRDGVDPISARRVLVGVSAKGFQFIPGRNVYFVSVVKGKEIDIAADLQKSHGNKVEFVSHIAKDVFSKCVRKKTG